MIRVLNLLGIWLLATLVILTGTAHADAPEWRERVQVLYDPAARSVERRVVRVFDMFPGQNLVFMWEPGPDNSAPVDPETSNAQGDGKLIWRVRGMADYDKRAIYAVFEGYLAQGQAQGEGRIEIRTGETYEGAWVAGLREGEGYLRDAQGNHYEGAFKAGLPDGTGTYTALDGTVYAGAFRGGLRHGEGVIRLPGGTEYRSVWQGGTEIDSDRPDMMLDALTGGLLRAQAGDDASRVTLSPVIDQRRGDLEALRYTAQPMDGGVGIYPANREVIDGWNLTARIEPWGWVYTYPAFWDSQHNNAYMRFALETDDGRPVDIRDVWLEVEASMTERKPFLQVRPMHGCIGHRPYFGLLNHGWGKVDSATLRYRFAPLEAAENPALLSRSTRMFEAPVGDFSDSSVVHVGAALPQLGVNVAGLENSRLRCTIADPYDHASCVAQLQENPAFGELAPLIGIVDNLASIGIDGELEYSWTDAQGMSQTATQPLSASVSLAWVDGVGMAEMGSAYEEFVDSPRHILVDFPLDRENYSYGLDYRGERRVTRVDIPVKLRAEAASIHAFRAAVRFADGSVRYSQPLRFFYVQPRMSVNEDVIFAYEPQECFDFEY